MPELPDVERFKQYVDATALHQKVESVEVRDAGVLKNISGRKLQSQLKGEPFESTSRHGKFLFAHPPSPPLLVLHFGMTGYLDYAQENGEPPDHSRVVFHFGTGGRLAYVCQRKLGLVTLAEDRQAFIEKRDLGPDALALAGQFNAFSERLSGRRGAIKSALMNQGIMAGIGNVYADEILYQARIAPDRRTEGLDEKTLRKLHRTMRRVLNTSIRNNAEVSELPRTYLLRHRDSDGRCPRCGHKLKKARIGGRGTSFCSQCQK